MPDILLIHGGVGSDISKLDELNNKLNGYARESGLNVSPLHSVVDSVILMENDDSFNAGTGSVMRIDGSIQMDAAVMVPGDFGSVIGIERVRNPVLVARDVMEKSPHIMLTSDGAVAFARTLGHADYDPSTNKARERLEKVKKQLSGPAEEMPRNVASFNNYVDYRKFNPKDACDTVGAVAKIDGNFAAAVSTGGSSPMLRGRVGDSPIIGAGIYCGEKGAVVATGIGEEIAKNLLCYRVYSRIGEKPLKEILVDEIEKFGQTLVGLIAVDSEGYAYHDNGTMPVGIMENE